jgi:predicted ATPase
LFSDLYLSKLKLQKPDTAEENDYVFSLPVVRNLSELELNKRVTFFVGENGTGKSTLLEAIAVNYGFNPEGGTKNFNFSSKETHSPLHRYLTLAKGIMRPKDGFFLRAETFYNVASEVDRLDEICPLLDSYGGTSLHKQSHGESFLSLMLNRFGGKGLYILDEPEAALSPSRQFTMLARMAELVKQNSQFIIATHSPILMAYPDADIFVLCDDGIRLTPYEETEHYILTKQFLDNPQRMLKYLCD